MSNPIPWSWVRRLLELGVPADMAARMVNLRLIEDAIAFYEPVDDDVILWKPGTGEVAAWEGRAFALGASDNLNPSSGALAPLRIHSDPLAWLCDRCRGLVVMDWRQAFDRLRDVPQVAVAETVLPAYRDAMRPRLPHVAVMVSDSWRAAA
jgi:hypothetical protein